MVKEQETARYQQSQTSLALAGVTRFIEKATPFWLKLDHPTCTAQRS